MEDGNQLELMDLWNIIIKRMKFIILITIGVAAVTGVINYCFIKPVYEVQSSIIIGTAPERGSVTKDSNSIDIYMYQSLMKTYSRIASSQLVINCTAEKLKNTEIKEKLLKNISVTFEENTQIMTIKYVSGEPKEAKTTLDTFIECFIEQTQSIYPTDSISVIDKAEIPKHPIKPKKLFNISVAILLGFMSAVFAAFLLENMDNTIKTEKDIQKYLKIPVIGAIPKNIEFTQFKDIKAPVWEIYRVIKNNIEFSLHDEKIQSVAITSAKAGEGKTTIVCNLAAAFAEEGSNTILIDCNLRNPKLDQFFQIPNSKGLSDFIAKDIDIRQVIRSTDIQNLYVITSGSKVENPSEIIGSSKMKNFIEVLKRNYDYIIMDTPQIIILGDSQIISQYCDGCVMIISSSDTERTDVIKAKELLLNVNARIIGAVLNKVEVHHKENVRHHKKRKIHKVKV